MFSENFVKEDAGNNYVVDDLLVDPTPEELARKKKLQEKINANRKKFTAHFAPEGKYVID